MKLFDPIAMVAILMAIALATGGEAFADDDFIVNPKDGVIVEPGLNEYNQTKQEFTFCMVDPDVVYNLRPYMRHFPSVCLTISEEAVRDMTGLCIVHFDDSSNFTRIDCEEDGL